MNRTLAAATAATALALALAACSSGGTPTTAGGPSAPPPSCHQQYETWKHSAPAKKVKADLGTVSTAASDEDLLKLRASLVSAVHALNAVPHIPRCADPAGYYGQMLGHLTAAADNIKSQSGLGGLLLAVAPLKAMETAGKKLSAELRKTAGE